MDKIKESYYNGCITFEEVLICAMEVLRESLLIDDEYITHQTYNKALYAFVTSL